MINLSDETSAYYNSNTLIIWNSVRKSHIHSSTIPIYFNPPSPYPNSCIRKKAIFIYDFLCAAVFLLGALVYQNSCRIDPSNISNFVPQTKYKVYVTGIVTSDPVNSTTHYGDNKSQFYFKPSRMQKDSFWHNVNGSVLVTVYGKSEKYRYGDELVLEGELTLPKPPSNPGGFDWREYLKRQKVYSTIKVEKNNVLQLLGNNKANPIVYKTLSFKDRMRNVISSNIPKEEASILAGILLGDREDIPVEMMDEFIKTGTIHILPTQCTKKFKFSSKNFITS